MACSAKNKTGDYIRKEGVAIKTTYEPLYQHIYNDIKEQIETGALEQGDRLATEYEIMNQYQVSRITVSRALSELAQNGYIKRFRSRGTFVTKPNQETDTDLSEAGGSTFETTIACIIPFSVDTIPLLLSSMQQVAQENHLMLSIFNSDRDIPKERAILEQLCETELAGVISYPIQSYDNISCYSQLMLKGVPLISIDKKLPGLDVPCLKTDNYHAMYQMVEHLIRKGHRRIAYYCHTLNDENENLRFQGYLRALMDHGLIPDLNYFIELEKSANARYMLPENSQAYHNRVNAQLQEIMSLPSPPTALACAYDLLAAYVEQQAHVLNISIPDQLSVTGFDNLSLCNHLQVPLTSAAQDYQKIGQKAIEVLLDLRDGRPVSDSYLFQAPITERSSVLDLTLSHK